MFTGHPGHGAGESTERAHGQNFADTATQHRALTTHTHTHTEKTNGTPHQTSEEEGFKSLESVGLSTSM